MSISSEAKGAALIALVVVSFVSGWWINGERWQAKMKEQEGQFEKANGVAERKALEAKKKSDDEISGIERDAFLRLEKKDAEIQKLRAAVDTGSVGLRVAATCSVPAGVSEASPARSVDTGGTCELDANARPDYFALRSGLEKQFEQLTACVAALKVVTE